MAMWAVCERITMVPCKIYLAIFLSVYIPTSFSGSIVISPQSFP